MIQLIDSFNGNKISSHKSVLGAVKAQQKHDRAVKRRNGSNSYIWYEFKKNGVSIDSEEIIEAKMALGL